MRGFQLCCTLLLGASSLSFAKQESIDHLDYDILTDQMMKSDMDINVEPPSKLMLFLRKFAIIPLWFYKGYRYIRTKIYAVSRYMAQRRLNRKQRR